MADRFAGIILAAALDDGPKVLSSVQLLISRLETYQGGTSAAFNGHLKELCGSDSLSRAIVTVICATSASNVDGIFGFKEGISARFIESLLEVSSSDEQENWIESLREALFPQKEPSSKGASASLDFGDLLKGYMNDEGSGASPVSLFNQSASLTSNNDDDGDVEGRLAAFIALTGQEVKQASATEPEPAPVPVPVPVPEPVEAQKAVAEPIAAPSPVPTPAPVPAPTQSQATAPAQAPAAIISSAPRASTAPTSSSARQSRPNKSTSASRDSLDATHRYSGLNEFESLPVSPLDAFAPEGEFDALSAPRPATTRGRSRNPLSNSHSQSKASSSSGGGGGSSMKRELKHMPRTSIGISKLIGGSDSPRAGPPRVRKMAVPSYMLPIGRTRITSPDRCDPAVSTREVEELFRETNLVSNVPQEEENLRLLKLLQEKADATRALVEEADLMWRQRLAVSLEVSIGALKRDHDRERKELKSEFESYVPNSKLVEAVAEEKFLVPPIKAKTVKPSGEHIDYMLKHIKAQGEHNITRFMVKRSALLIRQDQQLEKMKRSLTDPIKRLDRIKETQFEAVGLAVSRAEHKVQHCHRLRDAVQPLIAAEPKIRSKKATLEALGLIRHGLRLMADLAAKIPELYESVCIADGPIEASLPASEFRPKSPNFYPRSVVHGRSREDLVKELSSFLPYSDKSHLRSRSPSRERSNSPMPDVFDSSRPQSAPAGIFGSLAASSNNSPGKRSAKSPSATLPVRSKSASGQRKPDPASDAEDPLQSFATPWVADEVEKSARELSPLDFYRRSLEKKNQKLNSAKDKIKKPVLKKIEPELTWYDYLDRDGRCPWCLEMFNGQGFCLPAVTGPDHDIVMKMREVREEVQRRAMSSENTKRHVKRLLKVQEDAYRAQGRSPNPGMPYKFCSWECLKLYTVKNCQKRYIFQFQTMIDLAAGYIVLQEPPPLP